jgi:hypothetical protein
MLAGAAQALPVTVSAPKGINLGSTSFFDGMGRTTEGWTVLQYGRIEHLTRITDDDGNARANFKGTDIHVYLAQTQLAYTSPWHPLGGDGVGISALLPVAGFRTNFQPDSPAKLTHNAFGAGDLNIGPFYQSKFYQDAGRTVFAWRAQLSVYAPTGSVDTRVNINQGSGFWALNPFIAFTWLAAPRLELSGRINYQYNFSTTTIKSPPPIPGIIFRDGQAGQLAYGNFSTSYAVRPDLYLGLNGFALGQLTLDRTNGQPVPGSRETDLYIGPGGRYIVNASDAVNVNVYLPAIARNATAGPRFNVQFVHRF